MSWRGQLFRKVLTWHLRSVSQAGHIPIKLQLKTLGYLLNAAAKTTFGQYYQFSKIRSSTNPIQAFQEQIPLTDYENMYSNWWWQIVEKKQTDVSWPGLPSYFALSSGTSGSPSKKIPVTKAMLSTMRNAGKFMLAHSTQWGMKDLYHHQFFVMSSSIQFEQQEGWQMGDISGINASQLPFWFRPFYKPGRDILALQTWEDRLQNMIVQAKTWNLSVLAGTPSWVQMLLEGILKHYKIDHLKAIWPNLKIYISGGVDFNPYRQRFKQLLGEDIHFLNTYNTSEGNFAVQTRIENEQMPMELILNNGIFFEFIPFEEQNFESGQLKENANSLTIDKVEEGIDYALVISSCAGAWRYLIGDTIRFTNVSRAEIVITGRIQHFLSSCGEHLSVANMSAAVAKVEQYLGIQIKEFTIKDIPLNQHFEHHWYIGVTAQLLPLDEQRIATLLDLALCGLNKDYETVRRNNLLQSVKVYCYPIAYFWEWIQQYRALGSQLKFPRVLKDQQFTDWKIFLTQK